MMDDQRSEKKERSMSTHLHEQVGWFRESEGRKSVNVKVLKRAVIMEEMEKLRSDQDGQDQNENISSTFEEGTD